nr:DUF2639 domain-containing protein [Geobacillus sp. FJAT-46040]
MAHFGSKGWLVAELKKAGIARHPVGRKSSMSNFCSPPGHENPPFLPIMKNRRKQFNRTLCLMVA